MFGIGETIYDACRKFLIQIDRFVYGFVETILQLIIDLSKVEIFTQTTINTFAKRIYVILGLLMIFKMMVSFIQILIDPDTLTDKEKGAGAILKRVIIALIMIVLVPSIFSTARKIQTYILPIIPRVIMGVTTEDDGTGISTESKIGKTMAWYSFLPFFDYAGTCDDGSIISYDTDIDNTTSDVTISSVKDAYDYINRKDKSCGSGDYHYMYEHKFLISTIVGAYLAFTLVQVAINIAIRALKFGICEFIAPIPIASYVDPKTSKQTFDKWVSISIKVYLDLFIQLIVVYFVAFVFSTYFADSENFEVVVANTGGNFWRAALVYLFIIIGLIRFAKQFPKFLSDLLGLNSDGAIGEIFKGAWTSARETGGYFRNLRHAAVSNWKEMSNTQYADGSKPTTGRKLASVVGGLGGVTGHTIAGKLRGKNGSELTKLAFDKTTNKRNERIATKNNRINGYSWFAEHKDKKNAKLNISSQDDWAETRYREHGVLASLMSEAGALGLKKGEEADYTINTDISKTKLATALGTNQIKYTDLKTIANLNSGAIWGGHYLTAKDIADVRNLKVASWNGQSLTATDIATLTSMKEGDKWGGKTLTATDIATLTRMKVGDKWGGKTLTATDITDISNLKVGDNWGGTTLTQDNIDEIMNLKAGASASWNGQTLTATDIDTLTNMKVGDNWGGHYLTTEEITAAKDAIKDQQRKNKTDYFATLIANNDAGAIEVRNKIVDTLRNSPVYNNEDEVTKFAEMLFNGNNAITVSYNDENGVNHTENITREEFNRDTLIFLAQNCLADTNIQTVLKKVAETSRNDAQIDAANASRRNNARKDASK